ncbi:MAG TPA: TonB-dependent receptor [Gammaproteobacteria bacterium]|nr:TonB-dependent receptor [Gammaproteobacteria bacterium]
MHFFFRLGLFPRQGGAVTPKPVVPPLSLQAAFRTFMIVSLFAQGARLTMAAESADELLDLSFEQLMNVEISAASRFLQKISEAPSAVSVVTAADIKAYGYRGLAEILRGIRGLYVSYDRNYSYLGVRGFNKPGDYNTRVLLLVDGHRVYDDIYDQVPLGSDFPLDVDLIEQVEYISGPGSSIYGSGAFLGVINVRTRDAGKFSHVEIKGEAASAGTYRGRASAGHEFANGGELLLSASIMDSAGRDLYFPEFDMPATSNGIARDLDQDRYYTLFGKYSWSGWELELTHAERTKGIPTASYDQTFNDPRSETVDGRTVLGARYARTWTSYDVLARLAYMNYRYDGLYTYDSPPAGANVDWARGEWWDAEIQFGSRAFSNHHLIIGADFHNNTRQDQVSYLADPYESYVDDRRTSKRYGVFAQDEIAILPGWLLNAGLRYDHYDANNQDIVNPRLALIGQLRETTSVKLIYGTAFRNPNAYEFYYYNPAFPHLPKLQPERISTYEAIVEERRPDGMRLAASVFHYDISDVITLITNPVDDGLQFVNTGDVSTNGVEFEVEQLWESGMRLRTSVSWQSAYDRAAGHRLVGSPEWLAQLNFSMPVLRDLATAAIDVRYMDSRSTLAGDAVEDHTIVNLTLSTGRLAHGLEVSASVYNLFDEEYFDPGSEEHIQDMIRQDGRGLRVSLSYRF